MKHASSLKTLALCLATLAPLSAYAIDGTLNFTGQVVAETCKVDAASVDQTITMVKVNAGALKSTGAVAGAVPFTIGLTDCGAGDKIAAYFEPNADTDVTKGVLKNTSTTGPATNTAIQLLNGDDYSVISLGQADQNTNFITATAGINKLPYLAQYYATGAAGAGEVKAKVQFSLQYE